MPEVYRIPIRDVDAAPLDDLDLVDDGFHKTTVRRYKVLPGRVERIDDGEEDGRRISRTYAPRKSHADIIEMDRRVERIYLPERPQSSMDKDAREYVIQRRYEGGERPHSDESQVRSYTRSRSESRESRDRERSVSRTRAPNGDTYARYEYRDDQAREDMFSEERYSEVRPGEWVVSRAHERGDEERAKHHKHRHHHHHHHSSHRTPSAPGRTYMEREYVDIQDLDGDGVPDYSRAVIERRAIGGREEREYERARKEKDERIVVERDRSDRSDEFHHDHRTRLVYEKKEVEKGPEAREAPPPREPIVAAVYERRGRAQEAEFKEKDVVEKRERSLERTSDIRVERREEAPAGRAGPRAAYEDVYRKDTRKETDVYEREESDGAPPIVIRQRTRDPQKIIFQEAPQPAPIVIREKPEREVALARRPSDMDEREDAYYYRRETRDHREVGPYRGERPEAYALGALNAPRRLPPPGYVHRRYSEDQDVDHMTDDGYYVKRTLIRRDRVDDAIVPGLGAGAATSRKLLHPHRKRHICEGAIAGAGLTALLTSRRNEEGELPEHRGRKVIAGAALGAIGTEVARRAKSAYNDRYGSGSTSPERSLSRPGFGREESPKRSHSRLKTGLGIAAVALAAAGAAKYMQQQKIEKEEATRGRSRNRRDDDDMFGGSLSDDDPDNKPPGPNRAASMAKAGVAAAAATGLIQHFRKKSKERKATSKERSKSRMKTGAEVVAAGLAGALIKNTWDKYQEKKANADAQRGLDNLSDDEEYEKELREFVRNSSRSPSRSRTGPGPAAYPPYPGPPGGAAPGAPGGYDSAEEDRARARERRRRRRQSRGSRQRSRSRDGDDDEYSADSEPETDLEYRGKKKRRDSKLRDVAAGAAAGAAAMGLAHELGERKGKGKARDEEGRDRSRSRTSEAEDRRDRERDRERQRYEEEIAAEEGYNDFDHRAPSPPTASGGAYYPPPAAGAGAANVGGNVPPPQPGQGFTQHPNTATTNLAGDYRPYNPQDYNNLPPPPGPPPNSAASNPPNSPLGPDHRV